mmetsp:Transcript_46404/g.97522  ORF Transcript_46404/g.97522 Transcript_46404/m.97522 type:complete len:93 (-) Transcript_46404:231-509(-)
MYQIELRFWLASSTTLALTGSKRSSFVYQSSAEVKNASGNTMAHWAKQSRGSSRGGHKFARFYVQIYPPKEMLSNRRTTKVGRDALLFSQFS